MKLGDWTGGGWAGGDQFDLRDNWLGVMARCPEGGVL